MTNTKPVVSIARDAASIAAFTAVSSAIAAAMKADGTEAAKIQALGKTLAAQVTALDLPLASKVALIKATYADEFAQMASTKDLTKEQAKRKSNAVASLVAALTCYCAADLPVETKAPADGKPAEFTKAADLPSLSAMRAASAQVKELAKADEQVKVAEAAIAAMTPAQKAEAQAAAAVAAAQCLVDDEAKRQAAILAGNLETVAGLAKRLPAIWADNDCRVALEAAFLACGLAIVKSKRKPVEKGTMADQLGSLDFTK